MPARYACQATALCREFSVEIERLDGEAHAVLHLLEAADWHTLERRVSGDNAIQPERAAVTAQTAPCGEVPPFSRGQQSHWLDDTVGHFPLAVLVVDL